MTTINVSPIYHDFEPLCEWKRGEDLLIVHVPEFKKEHLKVQVSSSGALKINGQMPLEGKKATMRCRFYKETQVPEGCNVADVSATLCQGKLTIKMPRKSLNVSSSKCWVDEEGEEMIGFGRFKAAKETALNVGIAVAAFAAIGALVIFQPQTPPSPSPSSDT